jgi:hypothetical protein
MQIHSSSKILDFSRKGIRQAGETAKLHSYGQVLPLHVTGRNVIGIGIAAANLGYNLRDLSWGVAFISLLAVVSIELRKLCEVGIASEGFLDKPQIRGSNTVLRHYPGKRGVLFGGRALRTGRLALQTAGATVPTGAARPYNLAS